MFNTLLVNHASQEIYCQAATGGEGVAYVHVKKSVDCIPLGTESGRLLTKRV